MPVDGKGNFRHNFQSARMHDGGKSKSIDEQKDDILSGKKPGGKDGGEDSVKVHEVHEHPDGHFETKMHDGTETEHPDHLHMLAHVGHHVTDGDKHHVVHHDGASIHSHSIHEDGEHTETDGNSAEEAKDALDNFLGEEAQEPMHQHGGGGADGEYDGGSALGM